MPNWCENTTTFRGTPEQVTQLKERLKTGLFKGYIPIDAETNPNWYEERIAKWGTKWDISTADVEIIEELEDSLKLYYQTAWAPPIAFYKHLHELGIEVESTYVEHGMCFCGTFEDGSDTSGNYDTEYPNGCDTEA